jgi:hypothetical protein
VIESRAPTCGEIVFAVSGVCGGRLWLLARWAPPVFFVIARILGRHECCELRRLLPCHKPHHTRLTGGGASMDTAAECLHIARNNRALPMWARCIAWTAAQETRCASFWRRPQGVGVCCAEPTIGTLKFEALLPSADRQERQSA